MKDELIDYVVARVPANFFVRAIELMEAAYFSAYSYAATCEEPERRRVLGQLRHYKQNEALRAAAGAAGLSAAAPHTDPKGERYSLLAARDIRIGRIGIQYNDKLPRPAKHRKTIAALNGRLEPRNLSLFSPQEERCPDDGLGCLLVTVNPSRSAPQSTPAAFMFGVPYSSLRGWHLFEPVATLIAACHPARNLTVPDLAWARMKKRLGDAET